MRGAFNLGHITRSTVNIDDELMADALAAGRFKAKRDAVQTGSAAVKRQTQLTLQRTDAEDAVAGAGASGALGGAVSVGRKGASSVLISRRGATAISSRMRSTLAGACGRSLIESAHVCFDHHHSRPHRPRHAQPPRGP